MRNRLSDKKGQILLIAIGIMLVLLIIVPAMVTMVTNESRWAVKNKKSTTAYYLAEAAIDRGYWKMKESADYWSLIASGTLTGYNFDQAYSDIPSTGTASLGTYCIGLSSYSLFGTAVTADQRVITASGRDKDKKEIRTIELIIEKSPGVNSAIRATGVSLTGSGQVHWGTIQAEQALTLTGGSIVRWPRKYTKLGISPGATFDTNPAQPNYDTDSPNPHTEFWTYNEPPGVPTAPAVDIQYYKNLAQCSTCAVAAGYAGGGLYYTSNQNISNAKDSTGTVRYGEANLSFTGCVQTQGVTIAIGNLSFTGGPCNTGQASAGYYPRTVRIPSGAWQEYRKIDTTATGEYPGDIGGPGSSGLNATYIFGAASDTSIQTDDTISHEGFIYTAGTFSASGGTIIVGAVLAPNDPGGGAGGSKIYYQDDMNITITGGSDFSRGMWHQVTPYWPGGLP